LNGSAENHATNAAESVDTYFNGHKNLFV